MSLGAPSHIAALIHFLPVGEIHLWSEAGLFPPNTKGPLHTPGSSEVVLVGSPVHQTSYWEGTEICPSPKGKGPVALNSHWSPLGCGYSPWVTGMMPRPSLHTPGHHSGQGPQRALASRLGCQVALHAT